LLTHLGYQRGEYVIIVLLRVIFLVTFAYGLVVYAIYVVIVEPSGIYDGTSQTAVRISRHNNSIKPKQGISAYIVCPSHSANLLAHSSQLNMLLQHLATAQDSQYVLDQAINLTPDPTNAPLSMCPARSLTFDHQ
jgi:hypothetical protein